MLALCVITALFPMGCQQKEVPHVRGTAARLCASKRQQRAVVEPFLLALVSFWKALLISSHRSLKFPYCAFALLLLSAGTTINLQENKAAGKEGLAQLMPCFPSPAAHGCFSWVQRALQPWTGHTGRVLDLCAPNPFLGAPPALPVALPVPRQGAAGSGGKEPWGPAWPYACSRRRGGQPLEAGCGWHAVAARSHTCVLLK